MTAPSAKPLFKATRGQKSEPNDREVHDFYPTPREVTTAFLAVEGARLREFGAIWEPAAGDGAMIGEMQEFGLEVHSSDLIDRGCGALIKDFYEFNALSAPCVAQVTNPPYCEINARDGQGRWLTHSLSMGLEYIALFLNWDWPCAAGHSRILSEHPFARAYACRWKVDFTGKGSPPQRNGWFVWDAAHTGPSEYRFLDRIDWRQSSLLTGRHDD